MANRKMQDAVTVYSTDDGKRCQACGQPAAQCRCRRKQAAPQANAPKADGVVRVGRETAGRKGKGVTVITGVPLQAEALQKLAKQLKQKCGAGAKRTACPGEDGGANVVVLPHALQGVHQGAAKFAIHGVALARAVEGDDRYVLVQVK